MITASRSRRKRVRTSAAADVLLKEERRRLAADVHDLIMQDLSYALATARTLVDDPGVAPQASTVVAAAERALEGAREVMSNLNDRGRKPVIEAVAASVRTAARNVRLTFDAERVPASAQPDGPTLDALVHIGREAVTNAVKHADAATIEVVLEHAEEWRLHVRDRGRGFRLTEKSAGFGLDSMARRAEALGGSLRITTAEDDGTTVEALLP